MKTSIILLVIVSVVSSAPLDSGDVVDSGSVSANQGEVLPIAEPIQEPVVEAQAQAFPIIPTPDWKLLSNVTFDWIKIINDDTDFRFGVLNYTGRRVRAPAIEPTEEPAQDAHVTPAEEPAAVANDVAPAGKGNFQEVLKDLQQIKNQLNQTNPIGIWTPKDKNMFINDGDIPLGVLDEKGRLGSPAEEPVPAAPDGSAEEPAPDAPETN